MIFILLEHVKSNIWGTPAGDSLPVKSRASANEMLCVLSLLTADGAERIVSLTNDIQVFLEITVTCERTDYLP